MTAALHLALRFLDGGLLDLAERQVARALVEAPDAAETHQVAGRVILAAGRMEEALAAFDRAVTLAPGDPAIRVDRAELLRALGRTDAALEDLSVAIALTPDDPPSCHNLGRLLMDLGRYPEAHSHLERARELLPDSLDVAVDLARCLRARNYPGAALPLLREAMARAPDRPDLADALGGATLAAAQAGLAPVTGAVESFRAALARWPDRVESWANLSAALIEARDLSGAVAAADEALSRDPEDAGARVNRSFALCLSGDYERGLKDYPHRWRTAEFQGKYAAVSCPPWDGASLPNGVLLARGEQGLGDQIMAARFLPWALERVGRLVFECHPSLHRLITGSCPGVDVVAPGAFPVGFTAWIGAMDLALLAGTRADFMPVSVPYLVPPADGLRPPHREEDRPRVALVWAGKERPRDRSCPLEPLARLCRRAGIRAFSLQLGPRRGDLTSLPGDTPVEDLTQSITDMADTAALLAGMDRVISIDTAVAHLAGALGIPGHVLLLATPDWRWGETADRSIWYPTLQLVRQPEPGDWDGAFKALACSL
ncbi:MAG: tetratricopeptide repeat protein [Rhodospirillum sp.]|nr:tetratricopeptide repeat protein [Rhodospirillum sp.]MCF8490535.1 tetratricopeptide repeat protein [Rhodospirillum sp.]